MHFVRDRRLSLKYEMQALKNLAAVLQNPGAVTAYKAVGGLATAGFLVKYSYDECMFNSLFLFKLNSIS